MSANERMSMVEAALASRGVRDVKFFFNVAATTDRPSSEVTDSVAYVLQHYLDGKFSKMEALGDAIGA
jgi:hypothetical protein